MSEYLPDLPRYVRQRGDEWQGADHQNGPWRPIPAPQSGLPWRTDGPAVQSREPASVAPEASPSPAECGGPCWEAQDPRHCDCGALWRDVPATPTKPQPHGGRFIVNNKPPEEN